MMFCRGEDDPPLPEPQSEHLLVEEFELVPYDFIFHHINAPCQHGHCQNRNKSSARRDYVGILYGTTKNIRVGVKVS
jgi:hypothetical protein